jgi:hypothetical protein
MVRRRKLTVQEKRQRKADRINAKAREEAGLFAAFVEVTTEKDVYWKTRFDRARGAAHLSELFVGWKGLGRIQEMALRREVAAVVPAERLAELDARRAKYPSSPEYGCDLWRGVLAEVAPDVLDRYPAGGPPAPADRAGNVLAQQQLWERLQQFIMGPSLNDKPVLLSARQGRCWGLPR